MTDFDAELITGEQVSLNEWEGNVLLIVNTASECGFTPQYEGLQTLFGTYAGRGFSVLAFPCNQFGAQEPGSDAQIVTFCTGRFGVTFPMFSKVEVNGKDAHPLWQHLKTAAPGILGSEGIKWNFTKFLVGRDGQVIKRYAPNTAPSEIVDDIEAALGPE